MTVKVNTNKLKQKLAKIENLKDTVMPKAHAYFKSITPKKSGHARQRTRLDSSKTIQAEYAYAGALDSGASKQAPKGMVEPTEKHIEKLVADYIKRLGA